MEPCPNCGQPVRATARFCTSCGYRIPERPQGSTSTTTASGFASDWTEQTEESTPAVDTWPSPSWSAPVVVEETVIEPDVVPTEIEWVSPAAVGSIEVVDEKAAVPVIANDPLDEIVAATAGFNSQEDSIEDRPKNQINMALYHVETLRQLLPTLSDWSEDRAQTVNAAIDAMEVAIKGREEDDDTFADLRHTVALAKKDPRDVDTMIALADRAAEIEDLLTAHDKYSIGIRKALIELKPLAVDYVKVPKPRRAPARKTSTRSTTSKSASTTRSTAAKSTTSSRTQKPEKEDDSE